jgi:SAM-dependent methyltransferase
LDNSTDISGGYQEFPFVSEFYDSVIPYRNRLDIDFYIQFARESRGLVLELGCGTGRVLIPTARAGINITGFDCSSRMLEVLKAKLQLEAIEMQKRVELIQGDIRNFDLGKKFNLVTIPFRPFQHLLTVEDQMACLRCIHRHLNDEGKLVFDLFNPSLKRLVDPKSSEELMDEPVFATPDGREVVRKHRLAGVDLANQVIDGEIIYYISHPDGQTERLVHSFKLRYLFRFEVEHLLARTGFQVEAGYADFDKSPLGSKYPGELIFIAKKV